MDYQSVFSKDCPNPEVKASSEDSDQGLEIWCVIPFDGRYEASSLGRIRNMSNGRVLKPWLAGYGYWYIKLGGTGIKTGIHRLVAWTFHGEPPTLEHEVAHNDGNCQNNVASNLRWSTHTDNVKDTIKHGTARRPRYQGEAHPRATLTDTQVKAIRYQYRGVRGQITQIAKAYGVSRYAISHIVNKKTWRHMN